MDNIDQMQQGLEKALAQAAQADDRELAGKVREQGRRLVFMLHGLLRTSRLHDKDNAAFDAPSKEFSVTLKSLLELLGAVHIVCVEDQIYVNDIRLRGNPREMQVIEAFVKDFTRHQVGGISIHAALLPGSVKEMAQLVAASPAEEGNPRTALEEKLTPLGDIALTGIHRFRMGGEATKEQKDFKSAMRRGARVVSEAMMNLAASRMPNPLPVRRAVIDIIASTRESMSQAVTEPFRRTARSVGEQHLLSVTTLALALGQSLGLSEGSLSDLGVAAMLHDVGYTQVPDYTGHVGAGARVLMKQRGFHEAKLRRLLMVFEHHEPFARDGEERGAPPSLFARILHVVDDFDSLVSMRPGQPPPMSPALALASMWGARGTRYDPSILAVFAQMMGKFPPGTLLELTDRRWALSVSGARDRDRFNWPLVRIVRTADDSPLEGDETLDLYLARAEIQPLRVLDPSSSGISVGELLGAGETLITEDSIIEVEDEPSWPVFQGFDRNLADPDRVIEVEDDG